MLEGWRRIYIYSCRHDPGKRGGTILQSRNGLGWKSPLWSSAPAIPPAAIPAFISVLQPGFSQRNEFPEGLTWESTARAGSKPIPGKSRKSRSHKGSARILQGKDLARKGTQGVLPSHSCCSCSRYPTPCAWNKLSFVSWLHILDPGLTGNFGISELFASRGSFLLQQLPGMEERR